MAESTQRIRFYVAFMGTSEDTQLSNEKKIKPLSINN